MRISELICPRRQAKFRKIGNWSEGALLRAKVQLLNDNYTPMEFVVHLLERVFEMEREPAMRLMLEIHEKGAARCGVSAFI